MKCILLSKLGLKGKFKVEKGRMVEETSLNDIYLALYQYYIKLTIYVFLRLAILKRESKVQIDIRLCIDLFKVCLVR